MIIHRILLLLLGVFCCSTAVIMIKSGETHPFLLASYRLLIAGFVLLPVFLKKLKKHKVHFNFSMLKQSLLAGIALGIHFLTWIIGARMSPAAHSTLIANLVPVAMPFFIFFMISESLNVYEITGTILALGGVVLLTFSDFSLKQEYFWGDIICFFSMLFFAFYLARARKNKKVVNIFLYIVPLYFAGGIFCFLFSLFFTTPLQYYPVKEILLILGLGIIPTVIGHSILNYSFTVMRPQLVSLLNLGQFIFAGIMAFFLFKEIPSFFFYIACALIISAAVLVIIKSPEKNIKEKDSY